MDLFLIYFIKNKSILKLQDAFIDGNTQAVVHTLNCHKISAEFSVEHTCNLTFYLICKSCTNSKKLQDSTFSNGLVSYSMVRL